jgi:uncharacterized protein (DUF1501 family)
MGDFGRTPKLNAAGGRDHWPRACCVVLAGGGIRRGAVLGSTDAYGELPKDDPVEPEDVAATIYAALGIEPRTKYATPEGRPVPILAKGRLLHALLA